MLHLTGWFAAPHYDVETKRLEWGTRLVSDAGDVTVSYSICILGRDGVMRAILVSNPGSLEQDIGVFRTALKGFDFMPGHRYAEFRSGDKRNFGDGLIAAEVRDLHERWMPHADQVLADPEMVAARHPQSHTRGRRGAPAEVVLRLLVLKHMRNWSYGVLEREVRTNLVYRDFTRS